jgi:hypothetical protein
MDALVPEPDVIEQVIRGQRVRVKRYPPMSDPRWEAWIREQIRSNMGWDASETFLD